MSFRYETNSDHTNSLVPSQKVAQKSYDSQSQKLFLKTVINTKVSGVKMVIEMVLEFSSTLMALFTRVTLRNQSVTGRVD